MSHDQHWSMVLVKLGACTPARYWATTVPSIETGWRECPKAEWMLWILGHMSGGPDSPSRKRLVKCLVDFARIVPRFNEPKDMEEIRQKILCACEQYANRERTAEEVASLYREHWEAAIQHYGCSMNDGATSHYLLLDVATTIVRMIRIQDSAVIACECDYLFSNLFRGLSQYSMDYCDRDRVSFALADRIRGHYPDIREVISPEIATHLSSLSSGQS
jgi:hypothetical protein